jgi:UDP-glucose 4-epimerase
MEKVASAPGKRVLLTGSAGFIGKVTAECLTRNGYTVVPFDIMNADIEDIRNPKYLEPLKYDSVIHLAAVSSTPWARHNPQHAFDVNGLGTWNVFRDAQKKGVQKIIYASTSRLKQGVTENPYIMSKAMTEAVANEFRRDMVVLGLRFDSVYGPANPLKTHSVNVLNQIIDSAMTGKEVQIFGDGWQERDFIFVEDVAKTLTDSLALTQTQGIREVGSGYGFPLKGVINTVEYITKRKVNVVLTGTYPSDYMMKQKAETPFLTCQATPLTEGVLRCMQWYSRPGSTQG